MKNINLLNKLKTDKSIKIVLVVCLFAIVGTILVLASHANTIAPYASINADTGNITSPASKQVNCTGASDGNCVVFGSVASHIETWSYDDCGEGSTTASSLVQTWMTYAESNCGANETKALTDCIVSGVTYCTPVQYLDANWIYATGSLPAAAASSENWWLHEPGEPETSAYRIYKDDYGGGNVIDQDTVAADQWFQNYAQTYFNSYPALMMDDSSASLSGEVYQTGYSTTDEITTDTALQQSHDQMASYMTHASTGTPFIQIDNALSPNPNLSTPFAMLNNTTKVMGLVSEGSPMSDGSITTFYASLLDEMAYVDTQAPNDFVVLLSYDTSGTLLARRVQEATVLLGYSPGQTVDWADLETNSDDLAVWPEEGIVPTDPLKSMTDPSGTGCLAESNPDGNVCSSGGHNILETSPSTQSTGIFVREFQQCYNQGKSFGPCAAIMNDTSSAVTIQSSWLTQTYTHEITMVGGDLQSGGTVDLTGASFTPGSTTIAADDAALLSP